MNVIMVAQFSAYINYFTRYLKRHDNKMCNFLFQINTRGGEKVEI